MKAVAGKILFRSAEITSSSGASFAFGVALLVLTLTYRVLLTWNLFTSPIRPFDYSPGQHALRFILAFWHYDLALVLSGFLFLWLLTRVQTVMGKGKIFLLYKSLGIILFHVIFFFIICFHLGNLRLLFDVQTGLDYSIIQETLYNVAARDFLKFLELRDYLFLSLPFAVFWLVFLSPLKAKLLIVGTSLTSLLILALLSALYAQNPSRDTPAEIRMNPILFLLADTAQNTLLKPSSREPMNQVQESEPGIRLTGPEYAKPFKPAKTLPAKNDRKWNVVFLVMESVGTRYMFDTEGGLPMPMPFLNRLKGEGWYLKNHSTTSNVSTKAVFSIFSGLYDLFNRAALGTRPDSRVPSLYNFLGEGYDTFLVTPSSSSWYFPLQFMKNSGLPEMHTYENLNFRVREEIHSLGRYIARDEIQTVDFFTQRLDRAREPFLGIYISFAAHFPYFDHGPEYRVREDDGRLITRYYNNLKVLDRMIQRIFENLEKQGLLGRTILVIVGDHGQAFGQHHPDNFLHYRYSYRENLETPVFLYQPALFPLRTFDIPTNHADLLPTLLDAMRIPYNPALLDGESLFQKKLRRKYLFSYGLEETISSLDDQGIKVQYSLKKNKCWAYDLNRDPEEKSPLECSAYQAQLEALRKFVNTHDATLVRFNSAVSAGELFQGQGHPGLVFAGQNELSR